MTILIKQRQRNWTDVQKGMEGCKNVKKKFFNQFVGMNECM